MDHEPILGIDLGLTRATAAIAVDGKPQLVRNASGEVGTPCVVAVNDLGELLVGGAALDAATRHPDRCVDRVRQLLGRRFEEVEAMGAAISQDGDRVSVTLGDRQYSPVELAGLVLQDVKDSAEKMLGRPVTRAVVTVPAWFHDGQRQAVKDAAEQAGLRVARLLNEPTAAALAYGAVESDPGAVVVVNVNLFGLDVAVVEPDDGMFSILASGGASLETEQPWDELCGPAVRQTLSDAQLKPDAVRRVFLAGDHARLDDVTSVLQTLFGPPIEVSEHPQDMVALGAAVYGSRLETVPSRAGGSQSPESSGTGCLAAMLVLVAIVTLAMWAII